MIDSNGRFPWFLFLIAYDSIFLVHCGHHVLFIYIWPCWQIRRPESEANAVGTQQVVRLAVARRFLQYLLILLSTIQFHCITSVASTSVERVSGEVHPVYVSMCAGTAADEQPVFPLSVCVSHFVFLFVLWPHSARYTYGFDRGWIGMWWDNI